MDIQFKNFMSPNKDIRITSLSGHVGIITQELSPLPSFLWGEAYAAGAVSEDMQNTSLSDFITKKKEEDDEKNLQEMSELKHILKTAFDNPVSYTDKQGTPIHRKLIALIGKPVKKDVLDVLWKELTEENKDK